MYPVPPAPIANCKAPPVPFGDCPTLTEILLVAGTVIANVEPEAGSVVLGYV